jgi:hypothetical protein
MKNAVFWEVTQCGSCKNRRFGGTYRLHHQGVKNPKRQFLQDAPGVTSNKTTFFISGIKYVNYENKYSYILMAGEYVLIVYE